MVDRVSMPHPPYAADEWEASEDSRRRSRIKPSAEDGYRTRVSRIYREVGEDPADALDSLQAINELRKDLQRREDRLVATARRLGATWEQIAHALRITKQAAHQRWSVPSSQLRQSRSTGSRPNKDQSQQ